MILRSCHCCCIGHFSNSCGMMPAALGLPGAAAAGRLVAQTTAYQHPVRPWRAHDARHGRANPLEIPDQRSPWFSHLCRLGIDERQRILNRNGSVILKHATMSRTRLRAGSAMAHQASRISARYGHWRQSREQPPDPLGLTNLLDTDRHCRHAVGDTVPLGARRHVDKCLVE